MFDNSPSLGGVEESGVSGIIGRFDCYSVQLLLILKIDSLTLL